MGVASGCEGCLKRPPVESVTELPYPSCDGVAELPEGRVIASGHLRSGPEMRDKAVVERWELRERACLRVMTIRQEWPMGISDVEVVFDEHYHPLRAWKRMSMPHVPGQQTAPPDTRLYELRNDPATMTRVSEDGDFIRFREISAQWNVPRDWTARYTKGRSLSVMAAVRNLGLLWTNYLGVDPEAFGTTGDAPSSFQAFGPPTFFTVRFNLGY